MKTITSLRTLALTFCLLWGLTSMRSQCTLTIAYSIGANGAVSFTAVASPINGTSNFFWSLPGSTTPVGPSGNTAWNASATYTANGIYTVTAGMSNSAPTCSVIATQTFVINTTTVTPPCVQPNFNWTQSPIGIINFNNTSTGTNGGTTYLWTFGDGSSSTSASPSHSYSANGGYSVKLVVNNNSSPACIDSIAYTVLVQTYCNISAGFTYTQSANNVSLSNTSTGAYNYSWNYGDGYVIGGLNPAHNYTTTGTFTIVMTAFNGPLCTDTSMAVVTITSVCVADASFSLTPTGTPQVWNAIPLAPANILGATWYWGDGSNSPTLYTSHTYSAAGNYSICLWVLTNCGTYDYFCASYAIYRSSEDQSMVTVNVIAPGAATGISTTGTELQDYQLSPNPSTGSFNVSLKGLAAGSVKMTVFNMVGELVYSDQNESSNGSLSKDVQLSGAANGVYFLHISSGNHSSVKKIVIQK